MRRRRKAGWIMDIGSKIKGLRLMHGLTMEDLADRTELSKGFISQLERNLTSPSIATLMDILSSLGTDLQEFFTDSANTPVVFESEDAFVKEDQESGFSVSWLVPNAQKNEMEPILLTLQPGGAFGPHEPHAGEEYGYVLSGTVTLQLGRQKLKVKRGASFYFKSNLNHEIQNTGKAEAKVLWVVSPPSF
jgi:transcriptional regulator with XRE-family HTH domain